MQNVESRPTKKKLTEILLSKATLTFGNFLRASFAFPSKRFYIHIYLTSNLTFINSKYMN